MSEQEKQESPKYFNAAKLATGELVAFTTDIEIGAKVLQTREYIDIANPVVFYSHRFVEDGRLAEVIGMQPWIPISAAESFPLQVKSIVTISELDAKAATSYMEYLNRMNDTDYLDSMEDTEDILEDEMDLLEMNTEHIGKIYH